MPEYLKRAEPQPSAVTDQVRETVSEILRDVERDGEAGVRAWSEKLDRFSPESFRVSDEEISAVGDSLR
jgi:sulfopropanediol 3-dehydrogenase